MKDEGVLLDQRMNNIRSLTILLPFVSIFRMGSRCMVLIFHSFPF